MQNQQQHIDLHACIAGDRKAQYALYKRYKLDLYGVCLRYARNRQDAEDILQEGFYKIFKDLAKYSGKGSLEGWMRKVVVNTALMHIRKYRAKEMNTIELATDHYQHLDNGDFLKHEQNGDRIIYLIQQLPAMYQTVFNLRAIEEYPFKDIAQMLELKEATVRSHYLRARKSLQKMYSEFTIE